MSRNIIERLFYCIVFITRDIEQYNKTFLYSIYVQYKLKIQNHVFNINIVHFIQNLGVVRLE